MNLPSIFFCYAWETEERFKKLEYLRSEIIRVSQDQVEVILDRMLILMNYEKESVGMIS